MDYHQRERDLQEARVNCREAWKQMLISVEKFMAAEALFNERTDAFREKYRIPVGEQLSVECIMARSRDELWQNSVTDCRYYRERTAMFGTLHNAALERLRELLPEQERME